MATYGGLNLIGMLDKVDPAVLKESIAKMNAKLLDPTKTDTYGNTYFLPDNTGTARHITEQEKISQLINPLLANLETKITKQTETEQKGYSDLLTGLQDAIKASGEEQYNYLFGNIDPSTGQRTGGVLAEQQSAITGLGNMLADTLKSNQTAQTQALSDLETKLTAKYDALSKAQSDALATQRTDEANTIAAQKAELAKNIQGIGQQIATSRQNLLASLGQQGTDLLSQIKGGRSQRLQDLANLYSQQNTQAFSESAPDILEQLSGRGLLHSSEVGNALAKEKSRLQQLSQSKLQEQALADLDYEQNLQSQLANQLMGIQTSGLGFEQQLAQLGLSEGSDLSKLDLGSLQELGRLGLQTQNQIGQLGAQTSGNLGLTGLEQLGNYGQNLYNIQSTTGQSGINALTNAGAQGLGIKQGTNQALINSLQGLGTAGIQSQSDLAKLGLQTGTGLETAGTERLFSLQDQATANQLARELGQIQGDAQKSAAETGLFGNILGTGLGVAGSLLLSDKKVKKDLKKLGEIADMPIYKFKFKKGEGEEGEHVGFMAQDVEKKYPDAVMENKGDKLKYIDLKKLKGHLDEVVYG